MIIDKLEDFFPFLISSFSELTQFGIWNLGQPFISLLRFDLRNSYRT